MLRIKNGDLYLTILMGIIIAFATLIPADILPETLGTDKLHHLVAFSAFVLRVGLMRPNRGRVILLTALILGGAIELIQPYMNRSGEMADFWADAISAGLGILLGKRIAQMTKSSQRRKFANFDNAKFSRCSSFAIRCLCCTVAANNS